MAAQRFLARVGGKFKQLQALVQSSGVSDAGKIVALGDDGRLDDSVMPVGIGVEVDVLPASEALTAGDFVNIWSDSGVAKVRKADNTNGRGADGFVLVAVTSSANATVYPLDGVNASLTGLTPGADYWLGTAGGVTPTPLDETDGGNANKVSQYLGKALSASELRTGDHPRVVL